MISSFDASILLCCLLCGPAIGLSLILASVLAMSYAGTWTPDESMREEFLFLFGCFILLVSVVSSCFIVLGRIAPPETGNEVLPCDCRKIPSVIRQGDRSERFPLPANDGCESVSQLRFASVGAVLSKWIYDPDPNITVVESSLDFGVVLIVQEGSLTTRRMRLAARGRVELQRTGGSALELDMDLTILRANDLHIREGFQLRARLSPKHTYELVYEDSSTMDSGIRCILSSRTLLPPGLRVEHLVEAKGENMVQWALVVSSDGPMNSASDELEASLVEEAHEHRVKIGASETAEMDSSSAFHFEGCAFIVFRGTNSLADVAIDFGCAPLYVEQIGLRLHCSIWASMHSHECGVTDQVAAALSHCSHPIDRLVLIGHSLGGGYAVLAALELFERISRGGETFLAAPEAVVTFGCPMVVIPDAENKHWQDLMSVSAHIVNAWDAIPRIPSCEKWLFEVLPSPLVVGMFAPDAATVERMLRPAWPILSCYDACGLMCFVDATFPGRVMVVSTAHGEHRAILEATPLVPGSFVFKQHLTSAYVAATAQLFFK